MVLFSVSGSGIGSFLLKRVVEAVKEEAMQGIFVPVSSNRGSTVA
jgi:hypothetical protein